ncbi:hypothetical protein [Azospirillum sp. TSA6c]|uniref:hypothetical protein n=1 Tax=Azospirillum sp. TSA6c TaxID=709813 RepID=UPI0013048606|nr:hypothetical protein [Azospirillum sp. TSA6c]
MPGDNKGLSGLKVQPQDDAADLLSVVLKTLRVLGSITNRKPEAEGLSIAVLDTFGKR